MIGLDLKNSIRARFLRTKKVDYITAKPSQNTYTDASCILKNVRDFSGDTGIVTDVLAYMLKYRRIEDRTRNQNPVKSWSRALATAPWMANIDDDYYIPAIQFLIDKKILIVKKKYYLVLDVQSIKKNYNFALKNKSTSYKKVSMYEVINKTESSFDRVCEYIETKGKDEFLTLKISTFHARTYTRLNSKNNLVKLMKEYPNLRIQILCVGKYSGKVAQEAADKKHLEQAIKPGMLRLYKLAFFRRTQFKIRIVKDNIVDASLRCIILMEKNNIEFCEFNVFRTGYDRGNQGKIFHAEAKSSVALQINDLFDSAFKRAIPARRNFEWFLYWAKKTARLGALILIVFLINYFNTYLEVGDGFNKGYLILFTAFLTVMIEKVQSLILNKFTD